MARIAVCVHNKVAFLKYRNTRSQSLCSRNVLFPEYKCIKRQSLMAKGDWNYFVLIQLQVIALPCPLPQLNGQRVRESNSDGWMAMFSLIFTPQLSLPVQEVMDIK